MLNAPNSAYYARIMPNYAQAQICPTSNSSGRSLGTSSMSVRSVARSVGDALSHHVAAQVESESKTSK